MAQRCSGIIQKRKSPPTCIRRAPALYYSSPGARSAPWPTPRVTNNREAFSCDIVAGIVSPLGNNVQSGWEKMHDALLRRQAICQRLTASVSRNSEASGELKHGRGEATL